MRFITVLALVTASGFVSSAPPLPWSSHPHSTQVASTFEEARALGHAEMKKYSDEVKEACAKANAHISFSAIQGKCVDEGEGRIVCKYSRQMHCGDASYKHDRKEYWVETVDVKRIAYGRSIATRAAFKILNEQIISLKEECKKVGGNWWESSGPLFQGDTTGRQEDGSYLANYSFGRYCTTEKWDGPR